MKRGLMSLVLLLSVFGCSDDRSTTDGDERPIIALSSEEIGKTITLDIPGLSTNAKPLEMVLIPAGTFLMGSSVSEQGRDDKTKFRRTSNEGPQHPVTIPRPFYLGKYEVTQAQWKAVMGRNPSLFTGNPDHPVENVSWEDCQEFIREISKLGVGTIRLPTEAEWEYACRAGTTTRFYWGDDPSESGISRYAWHEGNSVRKLLKDGQVYSVGQTHPVGQKPPNAWKLYDMSGNVSEWCQDKFREYSEEAQTDPHGPDLGGKRVIRGGDWSEEARACRSADRTTAAPVNRGGNVGFRLLREYP